MHRLYITFLTAFLCICSVKMTEFLLIQVQRNIISQHHSTGLYRRNNLVEDIDFRIHGLNRYKLYPTENIYNFLQLDTMTGKIELVQWSLDKDEEGSTTLNDID